MRLREFCVWLALASVCGGMLLAQSEPQPVQRTLDYAHKHNSESITLRSPNGEYEIRISASNEGATIRMEDNRQNGHRGMTLLIDDALGTRICLTDANTNTTLDCDTLDELVRVLRNAERKRVSR